MVCPKNRAERPVWLVTFADLVLLLLCLFVMLLSYSSTDLLRFQKMAESLSDAFGVQRNTSVKQQASSPAIVAAAASVVQDKEQETKQDRLAEKKEEKKEEKKAEKKTQPPSEVKAPDPLQEQMVVLERNRQQLIREVAKDAEELRVLVKREIEQGLLTLETQEANILVRIPEQGSFPVDQAELNPDLFEVLDRISAGIASMPGRIVVAAHIDARPVSTARFRSNLEFASSRAVTVAQELMRNGDITPDRVSVQGHAEGNGTRRVEILLARGDDILAAQRQLLNSQLQAHPSSKAEPTSQEP